MKPDDEKTVEEWCEMVWWPEASMSKVNQDVIRRIQRAAFEKGAKAQRKADVTWMNKGRFVVSYDEKRRPKYRKCRPTMPVCCDSATSDHVRRMAEALLAAPLVEFEEE